MMGCIGVHPPRFSCSGVRGQAGDGSGRPGVCADLQPAGGASGGSILDGFPGLLAGAGRPVPILSEQGVGEQQELAHDGDQRDFGRLAAVDEVPVLAAEVGVASGRRHRRQARLRDVDRSRRSRNSCSMAATRAIGGGVVSVSRPGFVYVAVQGERPGYCKVGKTEKSVVRREKTLPGSSMVEIQIVEAIRVDDMDAVEDAFHTILPQTNRRGEWFNIETERVLPMLRCLGRPQEREPAAPLAKRSRGRAAQPEPTTAKVPGKTPQAEFRRPILDVLEELGGRGRAKDVKALVGERVRLRSGDLAQYEGGQVVWENSVAWARQKLKDEGVLKSDSPRGWWELATTRGYRAKGQRRRKRRGTAQREPATSDLPDKTPQAAFRQPILDVLEELGGRGRAKDVRARVGERVQLRSGDFAQYEGGQVVWENSVAWARQKLKDEGILKANSPWGWWELA